MTPSPELKFKCLGYSILGISSVIPSPNAPLVSHVPDSLVVRRESGQSFVLSCPRNSWRVNWFIYRSDVLWLPAEGARESGACDYSTAA